MDTTPSQESPARSRWARLLWQRKLGPAFWTITGLFSLTINIILIVILYFSGQELFSIKALLSDQLIGGLHENFVKMEEAVIDTTVLIEETIPIQFTLPLSQTTNVVIVDDVTMPGTSVLIRTGGLTLDANAEIVLPAGTTLPAKLNMEVPVDTQIPITLAVNVSIPLRETELQEPFVGLQRVVAPYDQLLAETPGSWQEVVCQSGPGWLCALWGGK